MIKGKKILVGVTGGIAAYKTPEIIRGLVKKGHEVRVVTTTAAEQFVSRLTLQVVSSNPVGHDLFDPGYEERIGHIELARWADCILIAPATANIISRIAQGAAPDLLSTLLLVTRCPVLLAPSMNCSMYAHKFVQKNIETIKRLKNYHIISPDQGELACKETGLGRMPDPEVLIEHVTQALSPSSLRGKKILITAGPTREAIDPVRFISNRSSGKMGFAIARAAWHLHGEVTLIAGPTALATPEGVTCHKVTSAAEMFSAVTSELQHHYDIVFKVAAVADFRPVNIANQKLKKGDGIPTISLQPTRDILKWLGRIKENRPLLVGFAAETDSLESNALKKLTSKSLDFIVANKIAAPTQATEESPDNTQTSDDHKDAFEGDTNQVTVFSKNNKKWTFGPCDKYTVACSLLTLIADHLKEINDRPES